MRRLALILLSLLAIAVPAAAFDLQGHRGARGLAPENTLPAFAAALAVGVATLEFDTGITADGIVIAYVQTEREKLACAGRLMGWWKQQQKIQQDAADAAKHPRSTAPKAGWP